MYSGEREYVEFAGDCMCEGPVETWLQNVVDSMKAALAVRLGCGVYWASVRARGEREGSRPSRGVTGHAGRQEGSVQGVRHRLQRRWCRL